jgi:hypothetical protein
LAETVKLATARELVEAGAVRYARLLGQKGGYAVWLQVGATEKALATKQGRPRVFARLDRAAKLLRDELGVERFEVDASGYLPADVERRRPDRTLQLRAAHAAAEHDRWFRAQVQGTLDKIEGGQAKFSTHDEVFARLLEQVERRGSGSA